MKRDEYRNFVDISQKENSVSLDWLEFTFVKKPAPYLIPDTAARVAGARYWRRADPPPRNHYVMRCCIVDLFAAYLADRRRPMTREQAQLEAMFHSAYPERAEAERAFFTWSDYDLAGVLAVLRDLGREPQRAERGLMGYRGQVITGAGVQVLYDGGAPGMGVHVTLSGAVCQRISDWRGFLRRMILHGAQFTRIDIAIDEHTGALPLKKMISKCRQGLCRSRLKQWSVIESGKISDGTKTGLTLYLGVRGSDFYVRCYDKRLEKIGQGYPARLLPKKWVRFEMEIKGRAVLNLARLLVRGDMDLALLSRQIINNYIAFIDRTDPRKTRCRRATWWRDWLCTVKKMRIARVITPATVESRTRWFCRQCAPSLAMLTDAHGIDYMTHVFTAGANKLTDKHRKQIADFKRKRRREQNGGET